MRIEITSVATMGKGITAKREKQDDDTMATVAHLKFAQLFVTREQIDALCGQPDGWCGAFYDDMGVPVGRMVLALPKFEATLIGTVRYAADAPMALTLADAQLHGIEIEFSNLGGLVRGEITWQAAGDELGDVEPLLGGMAQCVWTLTDGGQADLFREAA